MAETIKLPRSGLVLTLFSPTTGGYRASIGMLNVTITSHPTDRGKFLAAGWTSAQEEGRQPKVEAWLDDQLVALRSALLPPDAREIVARALWDAHTKCGSEYEQHPEWRVWETARIGDHDSFYRRADVVLAALAGDAGRNP